MELAELAPNPFVQFQHWLREAEVESGLEFPNAMSLATVSGDGKPSLRMVLLKGMSEDSFHFFTNYESRKGQELIANPFAALCFYWEKLDRQVRVEGEVKKLSREESQAYFNSRPRGSRLGAWASPQSREIPSRAFLEEKVKESERRFQGQEAVPIPPHWGGFGLFPTRVEFWKAGINRLHDRFAYTRDANGAWKISRLAP